MPSRLSTQLRSHRCVSLVLSAILEGRYSEGNKFWSNSLEMSEGGRQKGHRAPQSKIWPLNGSNFTRGTFNNDTPDAQKATSTKVFWVCTEVLSLVRLLHCRVQHRIYWYVCPLTPNFTPMTRQEISPGCAVLLSGWPAHVCNPPPRLQCLRLWLPPPELKLLRFDSLPPRGAT